eukprot:283251-Prymnesium_polylepis.2
MAINDASRARNCDLCLPLASHSQGLKHKYYCGSVRFNTHCSGPTTGCGAASALCHVPRRGRVQACSGSQRTSSRSSASLLRRGQVHGRGQQLLYNWKYKFIRPTAEEVCVWCKAKHAQEGARAQSVAAPAPTAEAAAPSGVRRQIDQRGYDQAADPRD